MNEYNKAIERLKQWDREHENAGYILSDRDKFIFPELAESEDEKTKRMLNTITYKMSQHQPDIFTEEENEWFNAYLERQKDINCLACDQHLKGYVAGRKVTEEEKQKEQKPEVKYVYPKFRIGDEIVEVTPNGYCPPVVVKYIGEGAYRCKSKDGKRFLSFPIKNENEYKLVDQKPAEWSEEEKDMLNRINSCIRWAMNDRAFGSCKRLIGDKEGVKLQDFLRSIAKPCVPQTEGIPSLPPKPQTPNGCLFGGLCTNPLSICAGCPYNTYTTSITIDNTNTK